MWKSILRKLAVPVATELARQLIGLLKDELDEDEEVKVERSKSDDEEKEGEEEDAE